MGSIFNPQNTMQQIIQKRLKDLEQTHQIRIWYACESGSRAWGFASPNSDRDVRFIYSHSLDWYLRLKEGNSTLDLGVDTDLLDFTGWELRKTLRLLTNSNASPFEWLQSPIIYKSIVDFQTELWQLAQAYFNPKAVAFHYYGLAKNSLKRGMKNGQMDLKKYFYVLRPLLALRWVLTQQTPPPMEFAPLLEAIKADIEVYRAIHQLVHTKKAAQEGDSIRPVPLIQRYIKDSLADFESQLSALPVASTPHQALNHFFASCIHST